ncbi:hypothetical protein GLYMA_10G279350v4 [Glycine max]|nr:hypothetical protein GLYMA_10G279350v4 [Glycine max]KAH1140449.1 hypothetical protein GYH30_029372 [Glycine max]
MKKMIMWNILFLYPVMFTLVDKVWRLEKELNAVLVKEMWILDNKLNVVCDGEGVDVGQGNRK